MPTCHICRSSSITATITANLCSVPGEPLTHYNLCSNCTADLLDLLDGCATAHAAGHPDVLSEAADLVADTNADDVPLDVDESDDGLDDPDDDPSFGNGS